MKTVGEFIRERRKERGLSARQLAVMSGMSDAHVLYIENAKRKPTFERLMRLLDALEVNPVEFLEETGYGVQNIEPARLGKLRRVPVVSWVIAGKWKEVCDAFEPGDADEWIDSDVRGRNVFALRVTGDSMEPEFSEGEVIIVNPHVEASPNEYVVVKNRSEQATFKQLKKYGSKWVLHPLNPRYKDIEVKRGEFKVIGKVVKKEKRYSAACGPPPAWPVSAYLRYTNSKSAAIASTESTNITK
jgi:SOS-response transcriptional repressor LexA